MKKLLPLLALGLLGCEANEVKPVLITFTSNPTFVVEKLGTIENCNVYRFADNGYHRYVTICPQANATTANTIRQGKTTRTEQIDAVRAGTGNAAQ